MLESTRTFPLNNVSQWVENNENLKAGSADFTGHIFTCMKLQNTQTFKSRREERLIKNYCITISTIKLLHQKSAQFINSFLRYCRFNGLMN